MKFSELTILCLLIIQDMRGSQSECINQVMFLQGQFLDGHLYWQPVMIAKIDWDKVTDPGNVTDIYNRLTYNRGFDVTIPSRNSSTDGTCIESSCEKEIYSPYKIPVDCSKQITCGSTSFMNPVPKDTKNNKIMTMDGDTDGAGHKKTHEEAVDDLDNDIVFNTTSTANETKIIRENYKKNATDADAVQSSDIDIRILLLVTLAIIAFVLSIAIILIKTCANSKEYNVARHEAMRVT